MKSQTETSPERPLIGAQKVLLTFRAGVVVLLFYAFALAGIFALALLAAFLFMAGLLGARFRFAAALRRAARRGFDLLTAFLRSFRLPKIVEARVALREKDAPGLFAMIQSLCRRAEMACPSQVFLEMQSNAWVRSRGWRRGASTVLLGVGFDLLAGLTQAELEAVLAHELTHGKLTPGGFRDWLCQGLERADQLSRNLTALAKPRHRTEQPSSLARCWLPAGMWLAETAAHLIAVRWRQEEFAADLGAVELCGAGMARQTLLKVESLNRFTKLLAWRQRVAQFQSRAFTQWLVGELSAVRSLDVLEIAHEVPDRLSTHPLLRDRLNALPAASLDGAEPDRRPAIELLPQADALAEKLIGTIQRLTIEREERDTKALRRWAGKIRTASELLPFQVAGAWLVIASGVGGAVAWITGVGPDLAVAILAVAVLGMLFYWLGGFHEAFTIPIPDFGLLKKTWMTERAPTEEQLKEVEVALRSRLANKKETAALAALAAKIRQALAECDYVTARAAARLGLELQPDWLQAHLVCAIASAWLGRGRETTHALAAVQNSCGLRGQYICWGVAWTDMLRGNWARAEALLDQTLVKRPGDRSLLNLRALCQSRRGKLQSAIISARRACEPQAPNREHAKFLIELLLEGGYLREAQSRLSPLGDAIPYDRELMLTAVRLNLLLGEEKAADFWAEVLVKDSPPAFMLVRLAVLYELERDFKQAAQFYHNALAQGFYPDAWLGLARVEAERNNHAAARQYALSALNLRKAPGSCATPPLELLRPILNQLAVLEPPSRFCRAWIATLGATTAPSALAGRAFIVYADSLALAAKSLQVVLEAMAGGGVCVVPCSISWLMAPPDCQPTGVARPGVQPFPDERVTGPFQRFQRRALWQRHFTQIPVAVDGVNPLPQCA